MNVKTLEVCENPMLEKSIGLNRLKSSEFDFGRINSAKIGSLKYLIVREHLENFGILENVRILQNFEDIE